MSPLESNSVFLLSQKFAFTLVPLRVKSYINFLGPPPWTVAIGLLGLTATNVVLKFIPANLSNLVLLI